LSPLCEPFLSMQVLHARRAGCMRRGGSARRNVRC
jgi:hypothetical protein